MGDTNAPTRTLDLKEAAEFLRLSPSALREKAKNGVVRGAKPGKKWVFLEADLVAHLQSLYASQRQALRVTSTCKEVNLCHSTNVNKRGGLDFQHHKAKEYDALLGLKTNSKRKNSTIN